MRRVTKKIIVGLVGAFIVIWSTVFITDYLCVSLFKEPIFVVPGATAEDGGSRIYYGFGYSVHVEKRVDSEQK